MSARSPRRLGSSAAVAILAFVASSFAIPACTSTEPSSTPEGTGASSQALSGDGSTDATLDSTVTPLCRHLDVSASVVYDNDNTDPALAHTDWNDDVRYFASPFAYAVPASLPVTAGNAGDNHAIVELTKGDGSRTQCVYTAGRATTAGHLVVSTRQASAGNIALGSTGAASFRLTNAGASPVTITSSTPPAGGAFAVLSGIPVGTVIAPGAAVTAVVGFTPASLGAAQGTWTLGTSDGASFAIALVGAGVTAAVPSPVAGGWQLNGDATLTGAVDGGASATTLQLTSANESLAGSAFWPTAIASQHVTVSFDARMHDGAYGADGLTVTFADPAGATPTSLGYAGGDLGFASIPGIAVALDSYQFQTDLPSNFVGVTDGSLDRDSNLLWRATATNVSPVRVATRHITVSVDQGSLRVALDGLEVIRTTVSLPPNVLVGFTAGTGGETDLHDVSNVSISTDAPGVDAGAAPSGAAYVLASCDDGSTAGSVVSVAALRTSLAAAAGNTTIGLPVDERGGACDAGAPDSSVDAKADASACVTLSLVGVQSYVGGTSSDVTNRIPAQAVKFAIPASVPILAGSSAHTEAWFSYWTGDDPSTAMTCHYAVNTATLPYPADGTARWIDCGGKKTPKVGTVVKADHFAAGVTVSDGVPFAVVDFELPDQKTCGVADAGVVDASLDAADASDATVRDAADAADTSVVDAADAADTSVADAADAADAAPACTAQQCDDGNPCTTDACTQSGCTHTPAANGTTCSDGNACTQTDTCQSGTCTGANPVTCTASDACHVAGTCSPATGVCSNPAAANGTTCSDGNACTQTDTCQSGTCTGASPVTCTASDACHVAGTCNTATGVCSNPTAANGTACSDGNACTQADTCQSGTCTGANPVTCTASDACHVAGTCSPATGVCSNPAAANGTTCSDGNACTQTDTCQSGACTGTNPVTCAASDQCHTAGTCNPSTGACSNPSAANGTTCNDGNACTTSDTCQSGACAGSAVTCTAQDACHVAGTCNASTGACSNPTVAAGTACGDNSNKCVGALTCNAGGTCVQGAPPVIDTSNPCIVGLCNPATGVSYTNAAAGTACASNTNQCVGAYTCDGNGACGQGAAPIVDDGNPCTADVCNPASGVSHTPSPGAACGDNSNKCALTYVCDASAMCQTIAAPVVDDGNVCTADACSASTGSVTHTPIAGCDPNPTTAGDYETRASLLGTVTFSGGGPATGYTVTAFDDATTGTPRSDAVVTTAGDGSFRVRFTSFPTSEPDRSPAHRIALKIESPNFLTVYRTASVHPGTALNLGTISVVARDTKVTVIDASGGTATDSQGLVEIQVPAGALSAPTPVRITPFHHRADLPATLPDATMAGYAMQLEPEGTQFAAPVKIRVSNWRNMPTTLVIPVGVLDVPTLRWKHLTFATWDGQKFAYSTTHFSIHDVNPSEDGDLVASISRGLNKNKSDRRCGASTFGLGNGSVRQSFPLPGVQRRGTAYAVGLNYDSMLAYGSTDASAPPGSAGAGHPSGITVAGGGGLNVSYACVPKGGGGGGGGSSGSCVIGGCTLGGGVAIPAGLTATTKVGATSTDIAIDPSQNSVEFDTDIPVDLPLTDQNVLAHSGYQTSSVTLQRGGAQCVGSGTGFGIQGSKTPPTSTNPGSGADATPVATIDLPTLAYHRHASPFGIGWGITGVSQVFKHPTSDEAALVSGEGDEEFFYPRARVTPLVAANHGFETRAFALDPVTHEVFRGSKSLATIDKINVADGSATTLLSGVTMDAAPHTMTIGYVAGVRHFLLSLDSQLLDVDASGNRRTLLVRGTVEDPNVAFMNYASSAAIVGEYAYYTKGDYRHPVLYRFHLTSASPQAEIISLETGGDISAEPQVPLSGYTFGDVHGLAPAVDGGLYVADRLRNIVYEVKPDASGVVSGTSAVVSVVGNGMGSAVRPVGVRADGKDFSISQPGLLFNGPDNVLWIFTVYGAAAYDPIADDARWLVHDSNLPDGEISFSFYGTNAISPPGSFVPVGPLTVLGDTNQTGLRVDVDLFSSETDPTRTISYVSGLAMLTDTSQDLVESFDSQGRLVEERTRAGDPIVAFTYEADTDRISTMADPTGGATTFHYTGALLDSITDAAGRVTTVSIDGNHDLTSFTDASGQTWTFTYQNHRIATKKSPEGDTTTYTYRADGTLASVVKPAGETLNVNPGYSQTPGHDANGHPTFTGSYDDAHGVTHALTLDERGRLLTEQYTAAGVSYTVQHERPLTVAAAAVGFSYVARSNRLLARETRVRINGLVQGYDDYYDDLGRWTSNSNGDSQQFASDGRVKSFYGAPGGDQFLVTRDASGRVAKIAEAAGANPTGREVDYVYRPDGLVSTSTVHGVTTTFTYDDAATRNLASTADTVGRTSAFTYDAAGNVATANDGTTTWTFEHDATNRLVASVDQLGNRTSLGYLQQSCGCSEANLLTSLHTPDLAAGKAWAFAYGAEGRLRSVTDPENRAETYDYEPTGELKMLTDRNQHTTTMTHDQLGRVLSIIDPMLRAHARAYAAPSATAWAGQEALSGSNDGTTATTNFTSTLAKGQYQIGTNAYDVFAVGSDNHTRGWSNVQFYRDATFALSYGRNVDGAGRTTLRQDRPAAQLTSSTVLPTGSGAFANASISYEGSLPHALPQNESSAEGRGAFSYNTQYDLTDANGNFDFQNGALFADYSYTRDVAGRVTNIHTHANDATTGNFDADQPYTYYPNGLLHTSPQGTFTYDTRGLVQTRVVQSGTYQYEYDQVGRNTKLTYPDGHLRVQQFDPEGRITSRCYQQPDLSQRCYTAVYDPVGNPVTLTDPEGNDTIEYDALDRVISVTRSTGPVEQYSYNAIGALKKNAGATIDDQRPILGGSGTTDAAIPASYNGVPITVDGEGKITSLAGAALGFDHAGMIASAPGTSFKYDAYHRIVENVGASQRYSYDGANRSGVWALSGSTRLDTWIYDGVDHPLEHFDSTGNRQYYELDLAGNVRRLRAPGGGDLGGYRYTAFGQQVTDASAPTAPQGANDLPVRWKGRWRMYAANLGTASAVELYDMRARWWSPQLAVFVSVDDFAFHDQRSTLWGWPGQNPYRWSDPTGHYANAGAEAARMLLQPFIDLGAQGSLGTAAVEGGLIGLNVAIYSALAYQLYGLYQDLTTPLSGPNPDPAAGQNCPIPSAPDSAPAPDPAPMPAAGGAGALNGGGDAGARRPGTTRMGIARNNPKDWREWRDLWDSIGENGILSQANRDRIAAGQNPVVDDAWVAAFPGQADYLDEQIRIHHIAGSPITVPLPQGAHLDAHMPGGFRNNPGGPGEAY